MGFLKYILPLLFLPLFAFSQEQARVYGKVSDERGNGIELVNVAVPGISGGTTTDARGRYNITLPADTLLKLGFSFVGYTQQFREIRLSRGESLKYDVILLNSTTTLPGAEIVDQRINNSNMTNLNPREAALLPTVGSGIEDLIKTLPGVSSNNELSSQYTVRGGNFDENLVYVNGIEVYRPFLIRSGQQEGLSFLNSKLVSSISFSAGGFAAEYGDKLSSVLDITYKKTRRNSWLGKFELARRRCAPGRKQQETHLPGWRSIQNYAIRTKRLRNQRCISS